MTLLYGAVGAGIIACALYMILSRNLVKMLLGFSMLATGVNILIFLAGRIQSRQPPIVGEGQRALGESADPITQALILTAIVIGFALTVMLAVLVLRAWRHSHSIDARNVDSAEALGTPQERELTDD
ncbi:multicomponent Na+:H+ antiporter subunit C [Sphingobium sp. B2D3A]|uniref:sodium:proton antiporter n=1 Tax=Sphingobium TaxID=165695 RepID=UPI0017DC4F98|nr:MULTISPECIES: sodium:proton antiporter [Sphingobium]MCW2335940.1 multicomponent Na+:H+ antiporter subunit C [Sphingobium sp. B2D3A]MCW2349342.1 multicomponent Na+:H+ antiporter subunit C [Sphingobium sp. B12D2B]MCW2363985.1 multicomponent Na+:H+ antiporter subunit C [Sphingobium sp. B10D3B]MCW2382846.1 multicomponent Na+:H+ antiporter subunit C [Sphingobium sp. B2D3B]MCW2385699.1 multicomponent Na+:H+ antiporter subunit C [Sphingobium sp. B2D3D]